MTRHCVWIGTLLLSPLLGPERIEAAKRDVAADFLSVAPAAWAELNEFAEGLEGSVEMTFGNPGAAPADVANNSRRAKSESDIALNHEFGLILSREFSTSHETVLAENTTYCFKLSRSGAEKPWVIRSIRARSGALGTLGSLRANAQPLFAPACVDGVPLAKLVKSAGFKVRGARANGPLAIVEFECDYAEDSENRILGGEVTLSMPEKWSVRHYKLNLQSASRGTTEASLEYGAPLGGFLRLKQIVQDYRFPPSDFYRYVYVLKDVEKCTKRADQCRLSAFGFPEPELGLQQSRSRPWILIVNVAAAALFAIAVYFRWRARRAKAR